MAKSKRQAQSAKSKRQQQRSRSPRGESRPATTYVAYLFIGLAIGFFVVLCFMYELTQDDAYISFRYAANLLGGHGLVFNLGERVEGFTNFLWVIILAVLKGLIGLDYLISSRVIGVIGGALIFPLTFLLIRDYSERYDVALYFGLIIALLSNLSLPYWSTASLETTAFACMVLSSLVAEYRRPHLTPALLIIASLLRPEGVLVFVVILFNRLYTEKAFPTRYFLLYVVPLLPFAAFKILYYGSLFPNPYYAKSGVGLEYILSGLEYLWFFTSTVGMYGFLFLVPLLAIKRLWGRYSLLYLFLALYLAYIVWVGGDVLKVYRFMVPLIPVLYFLFVTGLNELLIWLGARRRTAVYLSWLLIIAFASGSFLLSRGHVNTYWRAERAIVDKMRFIAERLSDSMGDEFSIAASTIGRLGYSLTGHRLIDMLGLTDSYIARTPETVEGIESSWKERRFNNTYLLGQQPDFILFSTGYKPSAPAERALMMHSEFRKKYSTTGFLRGRQYKVVYMRQDSVDMSADVVHDDPEFVNRFNDALNHVVRRQYRESIVALRESWDALGEEYPVLLYTLGDCYFRENIRDSALVYFNRAVELDSNCWEARIRLVAVHRENGDTATAAYHYNIIQQQSPWILDYSYKDDQFDPDR